VHPLLRYYAPRRGNLKQEEQNRWSKQVKTVALRDTPTQRMMVAGQRAGWFPRSRLRRVWSRLNVPTREEPDANSPCPLAPLCQSISTLNHSPDHRRRPREPGREGQSHRARLPAGRWSRRCLHSLFEEVDIEGKERTAASDLATNRRRRFSFWSIADDRADDWLPSRDGRAGLDRARSPLEPGSLPGHSQLLQHLAERANSDTIPSKPVAHSLLLCFDCCCSMI
jgi:hypothetical protein